jgi:hypothetical protein
MSVLSPHGYRNGHHFSPSPPSHCPHHHGGNLNVMVEYAIEESSAGIIYPMPTRSNYIEWSLVMKVNLQMG